MEKKRQEGYYWVNYKDHDQIGYYLPLTKKWIVFLVGLEVFKNLSDTDFSEIDERRIERRPESSAYNLDW